jgi:hypothetical protein
MASEFTVPQIINFANISQYLAANENASLMQLKSGSLIGNLPGLLYMENNLLQNMNNLNSSSSTLRGNGEYVLSLCGKYLQQAITITQNLQGSKPIISGPSNQSVNVGVNAVFSVFVISATQVTYQWFQNGVAIPGATTATYTLFNAQLAQSGSTFFVVATNASGQTVSGTASLTVTNSIIGYLYYTATDPGPTLISNSDPFAYQSNYPITHNSPISVPIPSAATPNMFLVFKVPSGESEKSSWFNTALNNGSIPDSVFQTALSFGGFTYYYTRVQASMDSTQPVILT